MRALVASMPNHAKVQGNSSADKALDSPIGLSKKAFSDSWKLIRKNYGLHHKAIPDSLVLDVLAMEEGPDPECEERNPNAMPFSEIQKRTTESLEIKRSEIAKNTKKGGHHTREVTQQSLIEEKAPEVLSQLASGDISYKAAQKQLAEKKLPVPPERSLRRMISSKTGQKLSGK